MRAPSAIYHRSTSSVYTEECTRKHSTASVILINYLLSVSIKKGRVKQIGLHLPSGALVVIKRMKKVDGEMTQLSRVLAGLAENPSSDLSSTSDGSQSTVTLALGDLTPPSGLHGYPHTTCVCTHIHINKKT